jgi:hypothetical protein
VWPPQALYSFPVHPDAIFSPIASGVIASPAKLCPHLSRDLRRSPGERFFFDQQILRLKERCVGGQADLLRQVAPTSPWKSLSVTAPASSRS